MTDQDLFLKSCKAAADYPENIVKHNTYKHNLRAYKARLNEKVRADRLFCDEGTAQLDIWEFDDASPEFHATSASSTFELKGQIEGEYLFDNSDPRCRYCFIHAPHSRERLRISRTMFQYLVTYHQVVPEFLDFVFPFGWQEYPQDFNFSGFCEETHLLPTESRLEISELGRSGREFCMSYSLKSVEKSADQWPWSIRQTAVYHSFDVEIGKMFWIIVKGNELMKDRIKDATQPVGTTKGRFENNATAFISTLETHLIMCDWSGGDWRWYINFLETSLENLTRRSLAIRINKASSILGVKDAAGPEADEFKARRRKTTSWRVKLQLAPPTPPLEPSSQQDLELQSIQMLSPGPPPPPGGPPLPQSMTINGAPSAPGRDPTDPPEFSFPDLQDVQFLEDKVNGVIQVFKSNSNVLKEIRSFYASLLKSGDLPNELVTGSTREAARFEKRVTGIINDMHTYQSRAETLLCLLADRKTLLYSILDYRSMEANLLFAKSAHQSAKRMEDMTQEMSLVAHKTKQETVSMKIITLVTLFFLPGTFISTVMSTDIIRFQTSDAGVTQRSFQWGALSLWLAATLPLTFLTFVAWGVVYQGVDRRWFNWRRGRV